MLREKIKDRAAIILSGMMESPGEKEPKVKAAVDYAILVEKCVDEKVENHDAPKTEARSER